MAASSSPIMKRSDSVVDTMPEALRQSRYHMKKCFQKYIEQGKRMMKLHHLMQEMETVIEDKDEKAKLLEGLLGYILCTTQVYIYLILYIIHAYIHTPTATLVSY